MALLPRICLLSFCVVLLGAAPVAAAPAVPGTVENPARLSGSVPLTVERKPKRRVPSLGVAGGADRGPRARRAVSLRRQLAERVRLLGPRRLRLRQARCPAPAQRGRAVLVRPPCRPQPPRARRPRLLPRSRPRRPLHRPRPDHPRAADPASGSRSRASPRAAAASRARAASFAPEAAPRQSGESIPSSSLRMCARVVRASLELDGASGLERAAQVEEQPRHLRPRVELELDPGEHAAAVPEGALGARAARTRARWRSARSCRAADARVSLRVVHAGDRAASGRPRHPTATRIRMREGTDPARRGCAAA